ncbi:DUF2269 family protein [Microlunatus elymi]|uniref:DUF2269 family protein n=1 Tax=Microlunatus elymi TaxID=2596828 RepID=UPI00143DAC6A|nr:DUF2269 family protein [Microlunatus elymi]
MFKIFLALHLITAIGVVGPLIYGATTAVRGIRTKDASATKSSARLVQIYSIVSIAVVIFGFGLMSATSPYTHKPVASFGETWIWLSLLLWAIAVALGLAVLTPALQRITAEITVGSEVSSALRGRVAGVGGVTGLIFLVIIVLMVYQPGGH